MSSGKREVAHAHVEKTLTLRFTALVTAVLIAGVLVYAVTDTVATTYQLDRDLEKRAVRAARALERRPATSEGGLGEARVLDERGRLLRVGPGLEGLALPQRVSLGFATLSHPDGAYRVLTIAIDPPRDGAAFLQVAAPSRMDTTDLWEKVLVLLGVTALVAALVYAIGLAFARATLRPVHQTVARLEQFTADAGHELRTPLQSIRASLDVAERTGDLSGCLPEAKAELERASELVDRLLEMARLGALVAERQPVAISQVVAIVVGRLRSAADERSIGIDTTLCDVGAGVEADPVLLERLVENLVENAVKFAEAGSAVAIVCDGRRLIVHNLGPAIPPDELARIADPFVQGDPSRSEEGFGLGLAIVTSIAAAHEWRFTIASDREAGTTATVRFHPGR
jgi:signal transduction histidine kinase